MTIEIEEEVSVELDFDYKEAIKNAVNATADFVECPYELEVNVLLVDNEAIHEINLEQREIDRPTDVLSFPMLDYEEAGDFSFIDEENGEYFDPESGELVFGYIVISVDKVKEQAKEYGHSELRELTFLVVHSMLHLSGYDHIKDDERKVMEEKQKQILDKMKIYR